MQTVEVLTVVHKKGAGKTGKGYEMDVCQCILRDGQELSVGELILPKGHAPVVPGLYAAAFKLVRTFEGKVQAAIESIAPVKRPA